MQQRFRLRIIWLTVLMTGWCMWGLGCRKTDLRLAAIQVPGMKSRDCGEIIVQALAREQQIAPTNMHIDVRHRMIEVRYESLKQSVKNLEYTIAKAGFQANEIPADEAARMALPEGCR